MIPSIRDHEPPTHILVCHSRHHPGSIPPPQRRRRQRRTHNDLPPPQRQLRLPRGPVEGPLLRFYSISSSGRGARGPSPTEPHPCVHCPCRPPTHRFPSPTPLRWRWPRGPLMGPLRIFFGNQVSGLGARGPIPLSLIPSTATLSHTHCNLPLPLMSMMMVSGTHQGSPPQILFKTAQWFGCKRAHTTEPFSAPPLSRTHTTSRFPQLQRRCPWGPLMGPPRLFFKKMDWQFGRKRAHSC
jgi:hypothetical protein